MEIEEQFFDHGEEEEEEGEEERDDTGDTGTGGRTNAAAAKRAKREEAYLSYLLKKEKGLITKMVAYCGGRGHKYREIHFCLQMGIIVGELYVRFDPGISSGSFSVHREALKVRLSHYLELATMLRQDLE